MALQSRKQVALQQRDAMKPFIAANEKNFRPPAGGVVEGSGRLADDNCMGGWEAPQNVDQRTSHWKLTNAVRVRQREAGAETTNVATGNEDRCGWGIAFG